MAMEMVLISDRLGDDGEGKSSKAEDESSHGGSLVVQKIRVGASISTVEGDPYDGSPAKDVSKSCYSDVVKDGSFSLGDEAVFQVNGGVAEIAIPNEILEDANPRGSVLLLATS